MLKPLLRQGFQHVWARTRLLIRSFTAEDGDNFHGRHDDPEVARYQNWVTPFSREDTDQMIAGLVAMAGPTLGEWWMAIVEDRYTGAVCGDLSLHLSDDGHTVEIGYTFDSRHWGEGYAVESLDPLLGYLFEELDVTRVFGMLRPGNPASAMVLERTGFRFEGHTRKSFWLDGEVSDDWIYGIVREDWNAWRHRNRLSPGEVRLVEISVENIDEVAKLETHKTQEQFVPRMDQSCVDAAFPPIVDGAPVVPWMRAIEADGELVGFVMLALRTEHQPEPYLWRLLIDRLHQRRGIGGRALDLVGDVCLAMSDTTLVTSWSEGKGSPRPFYEAHGFVTTGQTVDDETEARRVLRDSLSQGRPGSLESPSTKLIASPINCAHSSAS
jgi:RimJ/RimL family protein N-acetyltransferase